MDQRPLNLIASASINNKKLNLYQGSALNIASNCLVNAANENLEHTGGIAGQILSQAGHQLQQESNDYIRKNGKLKPGQAVITRSYNLTNFSSIIHAVGPQGEDTPDKSNMLISTLMNSFKLADRQGYSSISVPALSVGIFMYPKNISAQRHFESFYIFAQQYEDYQNLKEINISVFTDEEARIFSQVLLAKSYLFPYFEYFGIIAEVGMRLDQAYCQGCQRCFNLICFEFASCGCKNVCDFCLEKHNAQFCFSCRAPLKVQVGVYYRCPRCLKTAAKGYNHQC